VNESAQFMSVIMKRLFDFDSEDNIDSLKDKIKSSAKDIQRYLEFAESHDISKMAEVMSSWSKDKIETFFQNAEKIRIFSKSGKP